MKKDYIRHGQVVGIARRKASNHKKCYFTSLYQTNLKLTIAVFLVFIVGVYCIMHKKTNSIPFLPNPSHSSGNSTLPPKPEERWRYIKELENHHISTKKLIDL